MKLSSLLAVAALATCASRGPKYAPALEQSYHVKCPESDIRLRSTHRYSDSTVHVVEACGRVFELEERLVIREEKGVEESDFPALRATLDQDEPPSEVRERAEGIRSRRCFDSLAERISDSEPREIPSERVEEVRKELELSVKRCTATTRVEYLGSDVGPQKARRYWYGCLGRLFTVSRELGGPQCDHHPYLGRHTCPL